MPSPNDPLAPLPAPRAPRPGTDDTAEKFAAKLRELDLAAREQEVASRAAAVNIPAISLKGFPIGPETLGTIPKSQAMELRAICFFNTGTEIRIGAIDPNDRRVIELTYQIGERTHATVVRYAISEESFRHASALYETIPDIHPIESDIRIDEEKLRAFREELTDPRRIQELITTVSLSDLVTLILAAAIQAGTSDVHIEAEEERVALRFRIDGVLQQIATIPKAMWPRIVSRVKLLAHLKLNVTTTPQDGRVTIVLSGEHVDVRVSALPTAFGESVVLRLLLSSATRLQFAELGIRGQTFEILKREIARPNGMIIATGPTGSGKTTTLYAILQELNSPETKIITLEDPIEYKIPGLNQSQIDPSREYTFARGLRAILRQDPDVVMVGEIRDLETADVAIDAALTGHLMISTIHTNSAAGAIPRLLAMGVQPFTLAPALRAIIGQRLVRRIHDACKRETALTPEQFERVRAVIASMPDAERGRWDGESLHCSSGAGCDACGGTGYRGRIGIYEVMQMSPEVEQQILSGKTSEYQLRDIAQRAGMVTMVQDGILKALDGITTIEEVFRVAE